jgi:drug/metabolite transporter (DMT)-like permease
VSIIPTRIHGIVDYVVGIVLIAAPWIFQFNDVSAAKWTAIGVGAAIIVYSLLTEYELGVVREIPMPAHLALDVVGGAFLALSPWLFGFHDDGTNAWLPHVVVGLADIGIAAITFRHPGDRVAAGRDTGTALGTRRTATDERDAGRRRAA